MEFRSWSSLDSLKASGTLVRIKHGRLSVIDGGETPGSLACRRETAAVRPTCRERSREWPSR
jgi:hypothetical protein